VDFASHGTIDIGVGMPLVLALGVLLYIFESSLGSLLVSRLLMFAMSAVAVSIIYLLGSKMVGKTFGFLAALLAIFEPYFLTYSIVPHSDVFGIAIALTALYLATSNLRFGYVLAPVFFYLAVFTRPEFFLILIIPILVFSLAKIVMRPRTQLRNSLAKLGFLLGIYVLPSLWVYVTLGTYTRFSVFERLSLFLKPEILQFTLDSTFEFYDNTILNQVLFLFFAIGAGLALFTIVNQFFSIEREGKLFSVKRRMDRSIRDIILSDKALVSFCVLLLFVMNIIVLTVFSIGYTIVGGTVIIEPWLPDRYLILPRLLISYPLVYPLASIVQGVGARIGRQK